MDTAVHIAPASHKGFISIDLIGGQDIKKRGVVSSDHGITLRIDTHIADRTKMLGINRS